MIERFVILKSSDPRPDVEHIIFCDGSGGRLFRDAADLELSHWRPNRTPRQFRADTSTEICFRFLDAPAAGDWTLAVNNHLDVDGILSVYALVRSREALVHRRAIVEAAEMGDFWGWGTVSAQRLFQGLTRLMDGKSEAGASTQSIYAEAFDRVPALIAGSDPETAAIDESLAPLRRSVALVNEGVIRRTPHGERFTHYLIPHSIIGNDSQRATYVPAFNEAVSSKALLWPHARAKFDAERMCLVSSETPVGWLHDLWAPGYLWADTENRWTVPGLQFAEGMQDYVLSNAGLMAAVASLQEAEPARGAWVLGDGHSPFSAPIQAIFPVVMRFVDEDNRPATSGLSPDHVAAELSRAFA